MKYAIFSPPERRAAVGLETAVRGAFGGLILAGLPVLLSAEAADLDAAIAQHRMGTLVIEAAPGAKVEVEQLRHEFWFGAAIANQAFNGELSPADTARYREVFLENFNSAVTENALKWIEMEPEQGKVDYSVVEAILKWTHAHHIPLRGHNIFWGIPNRVQPWLKAMDDDELRATLRQRALDVARRFRGRFAEYDLNNEMLHADYYAERLGPGITRQMADWVREADPQAVLYLNDYDILTGRLVEKYLAQIRRFQGEGIPFAGIGVQGHIHGDTFDREVLRRSLDRLATAGLPIRVTEFNMPGQHSRFCPFSRHRVRRPMTPEEEAAQARDLVDYYRICFAHPAVNGILMWGFWAGANWIPASSIYRRDWTPKPAAKAYHDLVYRKWWTRWQGRADANGRCEVRAFYGKHRVRVDGKERVVELPRAKGRKTVSFR
jgi:GH35 family endo-1,4-beta-xylanase